MDYRKVRTAIESSAKQEAVSVNHRALITRTLTKYPVDYALFRELLQNSADAKAEDVVISFESTIPGGLSKERITDIGSCTVNRLTVKNNGQYFTEDDWDRLKEIAKGNPDESKIGAFGVGFYSVFELTDEPLVHSGDTVISFYYVGDQLCYRREKIEDSKKWTVIDLPYREPKALPLLSQFIAFLTQSFVLVPLHSIELVVDNITLLSLKKTISPSIDLQLQPNLNYVSPDRTLRLKSWSSEAFQVTINYMNVTQISEKITGNSFLNFGFKAFSAFVPSSKNPSEETKVTAFLRKITGRLDVNVSSSFAKKMKDTVMKPPPKEAIISMLTENKGEKELSELKPPLSDYVFPKDINDAKIFIGFPTKQSSSFRSHIAINQLIPTMERTAVDMSNAYVKDWNKQILTMAGVLSRTIFEYEFSLLKSKSFSDQFLDDSIYIMNRFDFQKSTPDQSIGNFIAYGFWRCANYVPLPSQKGILPSSQVRLADDADFIEELAIVPQKVIENAKPFLDRAVELGLLRKVSAADISNELQLGTLTPARFTKVITWCVKSLRAGFLSEHELKSILQSAIVATKFPDGTERLICLGDITTYQDHYVVPPEYPLPPTCLPASLVSLKSSGDFETLGWKPLEMVPWLEYAFENKTTISMDKNMFLSTTFAENVLGRLSRLWMTFGPHEQGTIRSILSQSDCIPTQLGLKHPSEAYFEAIPLFPNLPVKSSGLAASKSFLLALGLRESVDVAFVLKRINNPDSGMKWSTLDVVKYLTNFQSTLKKSDWTTLRESPFFEAEDGKTYKASELYAPNPDLARLKFPCLKWNFWLDNTPEAKFIYKLGLLHHPEVETILKAAHDPEYGLANSKDENRASLALQYFFKNFERNEYKPAAVYKSLSKCVPCIQEGKRIKCMPKECFTDPKIGLFGLPVVHENLLNQAWKFDIRKEPAVGILVNILIAHPPLSLDDADQKFSYLSTVAGSLLKVDKTKLRESKFIPIKKSTVSPEKEVIVHTYPSMVFFSNENSIPSGRKSDMNRQFYNDFFDFVNFSPGARPFLSVVGVRDEPSITEVARLLVSDPMSMYRLAASPSRYLDLLFKIISEWQIVSRDFALVANMRKSKFLLGIGHERNHITDDGSPEVGTHKLATVDEIVIVDSVVYFNLFKYDVLTAPQEEKLETFYKSLGCRSLTSIVEESRTIGKIQHDPMRTTRIKENLIERVFLYLQSTPDKVLPEASRLLDKLEVVAVSSIIIERRIKFSQWSHSQPVKDQITACMGRNTTQEAHTLYVVPTSLEWFDVSQAMIGLLVSKPRPDSVIVLETMLTSNLKGLQRKGFNVDRILRKRAKEQEAEDALKKAEREKLKAETQERIRLQKSSLSTGKEMNEPSSSISSQVRGSTGLNGEVPKDNQIEKSPKDNQIDRPPIRNPNLSPGMPPVLPVVKSSDSQPKSFFSRMFRSPSTPIQKPTGSIMNTSSPGTFSNGGSRGMKPNGQEGDTTKLLEQGISGSRPFKNDFLGAPPSAPTPAPNSDVNTEKECNFGEASNLALVTRLQGGPSVYVSNALLPSMKTLSEEWIIEAVRFKSILFIISQNIFGISWDAIHMYLNTESAVIAFNYGGCLFFNLSYFMRNSLSPVSRPPGSQGNWNPVGQLDYWFTVFAHELAHNLCQPHGSTHSYYTENYIQNYLAKYKIESNNIMNGSTVVPQ